MTRTSAVSTLLESATELREPATSDVSQYLLRALSTVLRTDHAAVYVSTPITTGRALVEWVTSTGNTAEADSEEFRSFAATMLSANISRVRPLAERAERVLGGPVIDPTRLGTISGWTQRDYHSFWVAVIRKFARSVVFANEWEYSTGCSLEYAAAASLGIPTLSSSLNEITPDEAADRLEQATSRLKDAGLPFATQREILGKIRMGTARERAGI